MTDSIFTKIIKGEVPCHKVYEDNATFAFMDIHPIQPGQVLVVPKLQVGFIWDMNLSDYQALMATVHKVGRRMREVFLDKQRIGVIIEGLDVADHAHIKVFPFNNDAEFRNQPDQSQPSDEVTLAAIAKKLLFR